jgi:hypothetical protein
MLTCAKKVNITKGPILFLGVFWQVLTQYFCVTVHSCYGYSPQPKEGSNGSVQEQRIE